MPKLADWHLNFRSVDDVKMFAFLRERIVYLEEFVANQESSAWKHNEVVKVLVSDATCHGSFILNFCLTVF